MTAIHSTQNTTVGPDRAVIRRVTISVLSGAGAALLVGAAILAIGATHPAHALTGVLHYTLTGYFGALIASIAAIATISQLTSTASRDKTQFDIR